MKAVVVAYHGRVTGNPEVISSPVGLVPTNAPAVTNQSLEGSINRESLLTTWALLSTNPQSLPNFPH